MMPDLNKKGEKWHQRGCMMPDLIKKQREAAPKRLYDAGSHKKRERNGIIVMQLRPQCLPNGEFL
jgi:hypothetical protein